MQRILHAEGNSVNRITSRSVLPTRLILIPSLGLNFASLGSAFMRRMHRGLVLAAIALSAAVAGPCELLAQSSQLLYPAAGQQSLEFSQPFRWSPAASADAYFLYVGTSPGVCDVWGTGETTGTSASVPSWLPAGTTLWARIWTLAGGSWKYGTDVSFVLSPPQLASLIYPTSGQTNVDLAQSFRWTAVPNAEAYFLYVGTSPGVCDVWGTGETAATSAAVPSLPRGQTLWARVWTLRNGYWTPGPDVGFSVASMAMLLYPLAGEGDVVAERPFEWTEGVGAEVYFLYVGSAQGLCDIWGTGEISTMFAYVPPDLPSGRTLWARIWTLRDGIWTFGPDVPFQMSGAAALLAPTGPDSLFDPAQPFRWTSVAGAEQYFLYVGTSRGVCDVWGTGETTLTSAMAPPTLPVGRMLYARIWTLIAGRWLPSGDVAFTALNRAALVYPTAGDGDVDFSRPFMWTQAVGATSYRLTVGTLTGTADVFDTGGVLKTAVRVPPLPPGSYFGRLSTGTSGLWVSRDFTFGSTGSPIAIMVSPANGASNVDARQPFQWTAVPNAATYHLVVGTTSGGSDLADSGNIGATSFLVPSLPAATVAYARLYTSKFGTWRSSESVFTTGAPILPFLTYPLDGASNVDTARAFEWTTTPLTGRYRLQIGTTFGADDLHDSGEIAVLRRFAGSLPVGTPLYGRLSSWMDGGWTPLDFRFTVAANGSTAPNLVPVALWATDFVRSMGDDGNAPLPGTPLADFLLAEGWTGASCTDYAAVLLQMLAETNVVAPRRFLSVCLKPNYYDCHALVELQEPVGATWMLLDPTFDLTVKQASNGRWATAADVSTATRAMHFQDLTYQFLGSRGDFFARTYYLDYPLLYLNVYADGAPLEPTTAASSMPYLDAVALPIAQEGLYALQGTPSRTTDAVVNGDAVTLAFDLVDGLTYVFYAFEIEASAGRPPPLAFRPRRFVF